VRATLTRTTSADYPHSDGGSGQGEECRFLAILARVVKWVTVTILVRSLLHLQQLLGCLRPSVITLRFCQYQCISCLLTHVNIVTSQINT
jgi:hypothetical protein